jgi:hypothetical protein
MTPMNVDLKRRLKTIERFNGLERRFLIDLQNRLLKSVGLEKQITIVKCMILTEGDDTAFVQAFDDGSFEVVIDIRLSFGEMCDYLIHEFAHVGSWHLDERNDHGPGWGIEYAKLYRLYLDAYDWWFAAVDMIEAVEKFRRDNA